jgi:hypothetical protein
LCKLCLLCSDAGLHSCGQKRDYHREDGKPCECHE